MLAEKLPKSKGATNCEKGLMHRDRGMGKQKVNDGLKQPQINDSLV